MRSTTDIPSPPYLVLSLSLSLSGSLSQLSTLLLDALNHSAHFFFISGQCLWIKSALNMSHSTWYLSLWLQDFLTELKPYFSLNESTLLLFKLSIQTLATSPNRYVTGIPGSTANSSYLVKGIRAALSFSQECGMAELLTKSDRLDIQSLCSRVMPPTSLVLLST